VAGWTAFIFYNLFQPSRFASASGFPLVASGSEIMSQKAHGTSDKAVQSKLKWGCDVQLADRISNYNRHWAENAGYWTQGTNFLNEVPTITEPFTFYDSVTGKPLFVLNPAVRSFKAFVDESLTHGWPSFRDDEVVWENVRSVGNGEMVSLSGTHLGHNLPDGKGNRYCINLVSIAGYPESSTN